MFSLETLDASALRGDSARPKLPYDTFASATLAPCGDTLFLRGLPSETKPALFPENESDCRFVPLPSTTASRQENPPSSFFFYPLFMSPVALDQDPRKANPTPRGGVGSQHAPYSPDHSSSLRATPLSFSRARYSSTRSRLPSPAR